MILCMESCVISRGLDNRHIKPPYGHLFLAKLKTYKSSMFKIKFGFDPTT